MSALNLSVYSFSSLTTLLTLIRPVRGVISGVVRLNLALALSLPLLLVGKIESPQYSTLVYAVVQGVLQGLFLGIPCFLVLEILPIAGRLSDVSRGAQLAEQLLPGLPERGSVLEHAAVLFGSTMVFSNYHYPIILRQVYQGGSGIGFFQHPERLLTLAQRSISHGVLLAAPIVLLSLLFDLSTALLSRGLSRSNMSFELLGTKMCFGCAFIFIYLLGCDDWSVASIDVFESFIGEMGYGR